jgi:anti-sigma28 factor (negative regulator of flagellin synthesis)
VPHLDLKPHVSVDEKKRARRERIAALKAQIEEGKYAVDPEALSRKIVDAHLAEKNKADLTPPIDET